MADLGISVLFEGSNFLRLLGGLWTTVWIAGLSLILGSIIGVFVGIAMLSKNRVVRVLMRIYLDFIRIMPQLVLLFLVYFGLARVASINLSGAASAVVVFTLWGAAEMGDLVRGALISIPRHQYESAEALGMNRAQTYRSVILPQAVRHLLPLSINLATRMIKTTTLIALIGVIEALKVGQQIIDANRFDYPDAALWIYGVIFLAYFLICFPLSLGARRLEKKWAN
ncbi:amino acid ABC transporter permease [Changpingibacter yushuensis]|uniref:amino acid ABC transporter permease n=1 Tax=Changpingibacter yushuensis TaxID=2758440 RepID=UPI00165D405D|nr:amino acid ABC transporter permease [Changpingibacter yushuensis]